MGDCVREGGVVLYSCSWVGRLRLTLSREFFPLAVPSLALCGCLLDDVGPSVVAKPGELVSFHL